MTVEQLRRAAQLLEEATEYQRQHGGGGLTPSVWVRNAGYGLVAVRRYVYLETPGAPSAASGYHTALLTADGRVIIHQVAP